MADDDANKDNSYDDEIIALLHQVGQRLLHSEQDRKHLKIAMDDLVEKADQTERAFLTVQDRINKTEAIIEKRQRVLERVQKDQMERVEKAVAMTEKIEEALAQHSRINRRLDKVVQDKARMIRKLDRIEEAVIEAQDSNNKAFALLTQQGSGGGAGLPPTRTANDDGFAEEAPWWKQHAPVRAAAVAGMVLLGVAGGWAINTIQTGGFTQGSYTQTAMVDEAVDNGDLSQPPSFDALADYSEPQPEMDEDTERFTRAVQGALEDQGGPYAEPYAESKSKTDPVLTKTKTVEKEPAPAVQEEQAVEEAPPYLDDEELLASLDSDPDALAAQLNEISPAAAASIIDEIHDAAPQTETKKAEEVYYTPANKAKAEPEPEMTTAEFLASQTGKAPLRQRITSDPSLPPVIKEVEAKAFEGIPEAQHDLAAIYTAGHGGVAMNYERAAMWFRESALQGIANARYNLGVLYHQGLGVEEDINMAVQWYRAAADMQHPEAQYNLGIAYIEGIGTRYDPEKAAYYFKEAADNGILEAAYNLGLIHENGLTGNSRPDEALYWYKQAADMGSPEAKIAMDQLAKTLGLTPAEVDKMYSKVKDDKKAEAAMPKVTPETKPVKTAQAKPASAPQKPKVHATASISESGIEYIEAKPLDAAKEEVSKFVEVEPQAGKNIDADLATVAQIQEQLIRLGLYPGPADGVYDSLTEDAITAYQVQYNLGRDGHPSEALLVHMMTSDIDAATEFGSNGQ